MHDYAITLYGSSLKGEPRMHKISDRYEPIGENLLSSHEGKTSNVVTVVRPTHNFKVLELAHFVELFLVKYLWQKYSRSFPPGQKYNTTADLEKYIVDGFEYRMLDALQFYAKEIH